MSKNSEQIAEIMKKHPDAESKSDQAAFELNDIAKDGIDIVKDIQIEYDDWIEASVDSEWTIRTLKLWFFMLKDKNAWSQWPAIFNDAEFMTKACETIEEEIGELHTYLVNGSQKFTFDDLEHLVKIECLIQHLGGPINVDPSAEACDSSVSTFVMFVLRDALEYAGLMPEKKRVPHRELKLCVYKNTFYTQKLEQLNDALD